MHRFQFQQLKQSIRDTIRGHCVEVEDDAWILVPGKDSEYANIYFKVLEGNGEKLVSENHIKLGLTLGKLMPICYGFSPAIWTAMSPKNTYDGPSEKKDDLWFGCNVKF